MYDFDFDKGRKKEKKEKEKKEKFSDSKPRHFPRKWPRQKQNRLGLGKGSEIFIFLWGGSQKYFVVIFHPRTIPSGNFFVWVGGGGGC